jgi:hypothetical protein
VAVRCARAQGLGCLLAAGLLAGCAPSGQETDFLARKASLQRQNRGIRELIAEAERGSLVPTDRFLVGIDEKIVADLLRSQLPLERPLGKRFIVHLHSATVLLRDKFGAITIEGSIYRRKTPERKTAVRILGGLGAVAIDPKTDLLSVSIALDRIELLEAGILEKFLGSGGKKFIAEKGRGYLQDALPALKIPVGLAQNLRVPAIQEGPIQLDSLVVPLNLSVERVIAVGGKLWVTLNAEVGKVTGGEEGLGVAVKKKPRKPGAAPSPKPLPRSGAASPPGSSRPANTNHAGGGA